MPSRPELASLAKAKSPTVLDGERFALNAARLLMDVRTDADVKSVIDAIFRGGADAATRAYAEQQLSEQEDLGRFVDAGTEQWIRSSFASGSPTQGQVEVALNLTAPALSFSTWGIIRIDVEWHEGAWRAVSFSEGPSGPATAKNLTEAEQRSFLVDGGWRRIAPS